MKSVTAIVPIVMVIFAHAVAAQPGASRLAPRIVGADCDGDNPFTCSDAFEACNNINPLSRRRDQQLFAQSADGQAFFISNGVPPGSTNADAKSACLLLANLCCVGGPTGGGTMRRATLKNPSNPNIGNYQLISANDNPP
jgi:hypothetical protein